MSSVITSVKRPRPTSTARAKRVRTGCLTCRERHLKCDEGKPRCQNCTKSRRECRWGVRLSYMPTKIFAPKRIPYARRWEDFCDESRQVASDYPHGLIDYEQALYKLRTPPQQPLLKPEPQRVGQYVPQPYKQPQYSRDFPAAGEQTPNTRPQLLTLPPSPPQSARRLILSDQTPLTENALHLYRNSHHPPIKPEPTPLLSEQRTLPTVTGFAARFPLVKQEASSDRSGGSSALSIVPQIIHAPLVSNRGSGGSRSCEEICTPSPGDAGPSEGEREYLGSPEEVRYMQVFAEEVGVWMDSFDKGNHFSQLIPYDALKSPMLLNAFLACGVMPLSAVSKELDDKALCYYNTATTHLLRSLQNPDRNNEECATAAVVLNVYEVMSDSPTNRMKHASGARALIKDCGWNGKSPGIGSACFWLNIEMEVLDCLAMKWHTAWSPDEWGVDMSFNAAPEDAGSSGDEELWVQRIVYIVAKIANFRASSPASSRASSPCHEYKMNVNRRLLWDELRELCLKWNHACPRTMHPVGYLPASQASSKSLFPNIWLTKRAAILGRLFYHTALCVLGQTNPQEPPATHEEMRVLSLHHAHQLCGVIAHSKDRGISSVAIRCLATTGPALTSPAEQREVLGILSDLGSRSGWRVGRLKEELKGAWGWTVGRQTARGTPPARAGAGVGVGNVTATAARAVGSSNPLRSADFNLPNHPYQNWYQPPNRTNGFTPSFV